MTVTAQPRSLAPRRACGRALVVLVAALGVALAILVAAVAVRLGGHSGSGAASAASTAAPAPTVAAAPATTDGQVCGDLGRLGSAFSYQVYLPAMTSGQGNRTRMNVDPTTLAAQLGVLSTVGAPAGQINGSQAIAQASPAVSSAMITMTRDADRLAQASANTAVTGVNLVNDLTPIINSFTTALISCTQAGYQPAYFNPQAITAAAH